MTNDDKNLDGIPSNEEFKFAKKKSTDPSKWLDWEAEAGIDEVLSDSPIDRFSIELPTESIPEERKNFAQGLGAVHPETMISSFVSSGKSSSQSMALALASQASDLQSLKEAVSKFDGCALKHTAFNLVFGDGDPKADIMFVGEAPGADEDREGKPFVGISGRLLDRMIASLNIKREACYITNILPWRPPGNRSPNPLEINSCLPFIQRQIELIEPKILVLVGGTAAKTLLARNEGIMKLRGRWFKYESSDFKVSMPALAIFHPAFLLRSSNRKAEAWHDLLMLKKKLTT